MLNLICCACAVASQFAQMSGPFDELLAFPQGLDVLPVSLAVDWDAMEHGDVVSVLAVVEAWRTAAENGSIRGPVWPYDSFEVQVDGAWVSARHLDRYTFCAGGASYNKADGFLWRP